MRNFVIGLLLVSGAVATAAIATRPEPTPPPDLSKLPPLLPLAVVPPPAQDLVIGPPVEALVGGASVNVDLVPGFPFAPIPLVPDDRVTQVFDGKTYFQPRDFVLPVGDPMLRVNQVRYWLDGRPFVYEWTTIGRVPQDYRPRVSSPYKWRRI